MIGGPDDPMSQRQQAVLDAIRARDPRPTTAAQLAAELGIAEGALNITLRSLHRRRLIAPRPADRSPAWCLDRPSRDINAHPRTQKR